jgi:hypothetical protein
MVAHTFRSSIHQPDAAGRRDTVKEALRAAHSDDRDATGHVDARDLCG